MNRITALLLAMAVTLVHVLVLHRDARGLFAGPYESAHAAFHLGRMFAREGAPVWILGNGESPSLGGLWSYPSPLLVLISAAAEFVGLTVTRTAQVVGILFTLFTVYLSTRFDTDRIAGIVPALLLVSSGAIASAAASGTEWPIAMGALCASFVALEHGRSRIATIALVLLVLARPEGIVAALVLLLQACLRRARRKSASRAPHPVVFVPAGLAVFAAHTAGSSLIPDITRAFRFEEAATRQGLAQLRDMAVTSPSLVLLAFPIVALALRELAGSGRRALALLIAWSGTAVCLGGGPSAFDIAFVPALPVAFVAIQQGIARALDTYRLSMERLAWAAIALALGASLLGSRFPGNLGRLELGEFQERVWSPKADQSPGREGLLARPSLHAEILHTMSTRQVGVFLRDRLDKGASLLTPWPGAIGYLSQLQVLDLFGRTTRITENGPTPWSPEPPSLDILSALDQNPDYILPALNGLHAYVRGQLPDGFPEAILALDPNDGPELRTAIRESLARYEIVVTTGRRTRRNAVERPLLLLRRRDLAPPPRLMAEVKDGVVHIELALPEGLEDRASTALPQVFDVIVEGVDPSGNVVPLGPDGGRNSSPNRKTLMGVVADPLWESAISLARIPVRRDAGQAPWVRIDARLVHHMTRTTDPLADAAPPIRLPIR